MATSISIWKELRELGRDGESGEEAGKAGEDSDELNQFAPSSNQACSVNCYQSRSHSTCLRGKLRESSFHPLKVVPHVRGFCGGSCSGSCSVCKGFF